jgi:hypothetical protein
MLMDDLEQDTQSVSTEEAEAPTESNFLVVDHQGIEMSYGLHWELIEASTVGERNKQTTSYLTEHKDSDGVVLKAKNSVCIGVIPPDLSSDSYSAAASLAATYGNGVFVYKIVGSPDEIGENDRYWVCQIVDGLIHSGMDVVCDYESAQETLNNYIISFEQEGTIYYGDNGLLIEVDQDRYQDLAFNDLIAAMSPNAVQINELSTQLAASAKTKIIIAVAAALVLVFLFTIFSFLFGSNDEDQNAPIVIENTDLTPTEIWNNYIASATNKFSNEIDSYLTFIPSTEWGEALENTLNTETFRHGDWQLSKVTCQNVKSNCTFLWKNIKGYSTNKDLHLIYPNATYNADGRTAFYTKDLQGLQPIEKLQVMDFYSSLPLKDEFIIEHTSIIQKLTMSGIVKYALLSDKEIGVDKNSQPNIQLDGKSAPFPHSVKIQTYTITGSYIYYLWETLQTLPNTSFITTGLEIVFTDDLTNSTWTLGGYYVYKK